VDNALCAVVIAKHLVIFILSVHDLARQIAVDIHLRIPTLARWTLIDNVRHCLACVFSAPRLQFLLLNQLPAAGNGIADVLSVIAHRMDSRLIVPKKPPANAAGDRICRGAVITANDSERRRR
jgi:hypothetical protein